jgi:hypothetical protein
MKRLRIATPLVVVPLAVSLALAGDPQANSGGQSPHISKQTRIELIHLLNAELVYVRTPFPMGTQGLKLHEGAVSPSGEQLQQALAMWGPAAKKGDPARISDVVFRDNFIHVEINGGPVHKKKWYEHISVGGAAGDAPIAPSDPQANARGSFVDVYFEPYVPEMTGDDLKAALGPVLDFRAKSQQEAYLDSVPPKIKEAIQQHRVLVGMNHEMVTYAMGRPPRKVRERDGDAEFEEWIYGDPPADVNFVRFVGDEVVRLEIMRVDGSKEVRTQKEVDLTAATTAVAKSEGDSKPHVAPSLKRPGEDPDDTQSDDRPPAR